MSALKGLQRDDHFNQMQYSHHSTLELGPQHSKRGSTSFDGCFNRFSRC